MKRMLAVILVSSCFFSCGRTPVEAKLLPAREVDIVFLTPEMDAVTKNVKTDNAAAIRKLVDFIDARPADSFDCGYDGKMLFLLEGKEIQEIDFKFKGTGCRHFSFELDGKPMHTRLSNEAADFLESLETGKSFY